jgi:hypothetical protein
MTGQTMPLSNHTLISALRLRKTTDNLYQESGLVLDTNRCVDLTAFLGAASTVPLCTSPPDTLLLRECSCVTYTKCVKRTHKGRVKQSICLPT